MKKGDKLTTQEKIFVKEIVKTGNGTRSVKKAFPEIKSEGYIRVKGHDLLTKPNIVKAIQSIADSIPDEDLIKVHKEGLKADKLTILGIEPDYSTRHKYLDSAYKIKGTYAPLEANIKYNPYTKEQLVDMLLNKIDMEYTPEQLTFFCECGKKSRNALIKKYGKEELKRRAIERALNLNKKRWGKD